MTISQVWGALAILILCPLLGGWPLIAGSADAIARRRLSQVGTGKPSVSAVWARGGAGVGRFAMLFAGLKGVLAVLLARAFFPTQPAWELNALIALIMGSYWSGRGQRTTSVAWGIVVHDLVAAGLILLIGGISLTIFRDRHSGRLVILVLFPLMLLLLHPNDFERLLAATALSLLLGWISHRRQDALHPSATQSYPNSQTMFRFFQGDRALRSLDDPLDPARVGQKAATLSQLKRWGYPVPQGWVLPAGDDPQPLLDFLCPSEDEPLIARSSAVGEDSQFASAAGQYQSIPSITSRAALQDAILRCQASYNSLTAAQYRRDHQQPAASMAVLVQKQIRGVFSGVAFSRDPVDQRDSAVLVEGLPGEAMRIVSGQATPQQYRAIVSDDRELQIEGSGDLPPALIGEVACLAREIEDRYHGIPQDIEWTYDGQQLWLLQARPVTTLQPIWTRKIAAEVLPGVIPPLTWSINQPLTCGVWGEIFTLVLGDRARDLDFHQTATLHYSRTYFNATLLGQIFRRMGLPPDSLEFLTRGAKFSKPPLVSTLCNLPGLFRLLLREWNLPKDFAHDNRRQFAPLLAQLEHEDPNQLSPQQLLHRIDTILAVLRPTTYYSILVPLSLALRQALLRVQPQELDHRRLPEVASLRSLAELAADTRNLLPLRRISERTSPSLFTLLAESPDGESILEQFNSWLERYGYLSEAATDIAVPRWLESPRPARELFTQFLFNGPPSRKAGFAAPKPKRQRLRARLVQKRLNLKAHSTEVYTRLLAHLRWSFVALEKIWIETGILAQAGDIFFLEFAEVRRLVQYDDPQLRERLPSAITERRSRFEQDQKLPSVPELVYGNRPAKVPTLPSLPLVSQRRWQGIGASPGQAVGRVKVLQDFQANFEIDQDTILVVPYTDSGWAPLLARAGGLVSEVGGRLSHGAIVAREYGIPAVMDIPNATQMWQDGQRLRIDGEIGLVELLEED